MLRKAWDGSKLSTLTRNSALTATDAHISVIGHITTAELRARLTRTNAANGFANRFLFPLVRRRKELPFGGELTDSEIVHLGERLEAVIKRLPSFSRVIMREDTREIWESVYSDLSADKPGLLGSITARAEAQAVRLGNDPRATRWQDGKSPAAHERGPGPWRYCEAPPNISGATLPATQ